MNIYYIASSINWCWSFNYIYIYMWNPWYTCAEALSIYRILNILVLRLASMYGIFKILALELWQFGAGTSFICMCIHTYYGILNILVLKLHACIYIYIGSGASIIWNPWYIYIYRCWSLIYISGILTIGATSWFTSGILDILVLELDFCMESLINSCWSFTHTWNS